MQGKSTTVWYYNMGERLSLCLTPAGMQLGFIAKEHGGSMGLQTEMGDWKAMDNNNRMGVSGWKLIKRTIRVRVDSGSMERIIAEARQGW